MYTFDRRLLNLIEKIQASNTSSNSFCDGRKISTDQCIVCILMLVDLLLGWAWCRGGRYQWEPASGHGRLGQWRRRLGQPGGHSFSGESNVKNLSLNHLTSKQNCYCNRSTQSTDIQAHLMCIENVFMICHRITCVTDKVNAFRNYC